jgi:hypothetical protein
MFYTTSHTGGFFVVWSAKQTSVDFKVYFRKRESCFAGERRWLIWKEI